MHPPFRFQLQTVLDYRQQQEDEARLQLAHIQSALQQEKEHETTLIKALHNMQQGLNVVKSMTMAEFSLQVEYRQSLQLDQKASQARQKDLEQAIHKQRQILQTKAMDRKLMENLQARQASRYEYNCKHQEQSLFDETATLRYGRASFADNPDSGSTSHH